jgi:hypothetical protein
MAAICIFRKQFFVNRIMSVIQAIRVCGRLCAIPQRANSLEPMKKIGLTLAVLAGIGLAGTAIGLWAAHMATHAPVTANDSSPAAPVSQAETFVSVPDPVVPTIETAPQLPPEVEADLDPAKQKRDEQYAALGLSTTNGHAFAITYRDSRPGVSAGVGAVQQ